MPPLNNKQKAKKYNALVNRLFGNNSFQAAFDAVKNEYDTADPAALADQAQLMGAVNPNSGKEEIEQEIIRAREAALAKLQTINNALNEINRMMQELENRGEMDFGEFNRRVAELRNVHDLCNDYPFDTGYSAIQNLSYITNSLTDLAIRPEAQLIQPVPAQQNKRKGLLDPDENLGVANPVKINVDQYKMEPNISAEKYTDDLFRNDPSPDDPKQGENGNCVFTNMLVGMAKMSQGKSPEENIILNSMKDNGDTVTVRFFGKRTVPGKNNRPKKETVPVYVTIPKQKLMQTYGKDNGFITGLMNGRDNIASRGAMWTSMMEIAYAYSGLWPDGEVPDKAKIERIQNMNIHDLLRDENIDVKNNTATPRDQLFGGDPDKYSFMLYGAEDKSETIEPKGTAANNKDAQDEILNTLNNHFNHGGKFIMCGSKPTRNNKPLYVKKETNKGIFFSSQKNCYMESSHMYTIIGVDMENRTVKLQNPHREADQKIEDVAFGDNSYTLEDQFDVPIQEFMANVKKVYTKEFKQPHPLIPVNELENTVIDDDVPQNINGNFKTIIKTLSDKLTYNNNCLLEIFGRNSKQYKDLRTSLSTLNTMLQDPDARLNDVRDQLVQVVQDADAYSNYSNAKEKGNKNSRGMIRESIADIASQMGKYMLSDPSRDPQPTYQQLVKDSFANRIGSAYEKHLGLKINVNQLLRSQNEAFKTAFGDNFAELEENAFTLHRDPIFDKLQKGLDLKSRAALEKAAQKELSKQNANRNLLIEDAPENSVPQRDENPARNSEVSSRNTENKQRGGLQEDSFGISRLDVVMLKTYIQTQHEGGKRSNIYNTLTELAEQYTSNEKNMSVQDKTALKIGTVYCELENKASVQKNLSSKENQNLRKYGDLLKKYIGGEEITLPKELQPKVKNDRLEDSMLDNHEPEELGGMGGSGLW